ncbi:MAG TPA: methyltransferase domain-containing protein, partial [Vicinamibacterales bacterium]|nr:methyltransferase domain-containing protein [Vicinamibacterales bacterium]
TLRVMAAECRRGRVFGIDAQREGLEYARRRVGARVAQADAAHPPFGAATAFDLVGMFDVLEHIDDDVGALSAIRDLIVDRGFVVITVPASPKLWSAFDVASHHRRRYEAAGLGDAIRRAGFSVEYLSPFMSVLYPIAWIRRRAVAAADPFAAALADLRVVPGVNGVLRLMASAEAFAIARRRRLAFGTSLIAIARRTP